MINKALNIDSFCLSVIIQSLIDSIELFIKEKID